MLVDIPKGKGRGTWQRWIAFEYDPAKRHWTATICCPDCGEMLSLINHTISDNGQVSPSVGHWKNIACPWHTNPRLVGWESLPLPELPPLTTCERYGKKSYDIGGWGTWCNGTGLICGNCFSEHMKGTKP